MDSHSPGLLDSQSSRSYQRQCIIGNPHHAVVVGGIHGDGTPEQTTVTIYNPWPPNQGAVEQKAFLDFDSDFGLGAGANTQIVSA